MQLRFLTAALAALLLVPSALALGLDATSATGLAPVEYIIGFESIPQDVRDGHYGVDRVVDINDYVNFAVVETSNPAALIARAKLDENVKYVEENIVISISLTPNDTFFAGYQYDVKAPTTNIVAAWDVSTGSTSVKVAIADTGYRATQEDLVGTPIVSERDFVSNDNTAQDGNGHGTHVATTIFARINNAKGIAGISQVTFMPIRVLNNQGSGTCSQVANGITHAGANGAHILSMSLGGGYCSAEESAVVYTQGQGTLIVAATGNDGPCSNCVSYPAKFAGVVAVGCTDQNNNLCSFSNTGPEVFMVAPGYQTPGGYPKKSTCGGTSLDRCYVLLSGTSMSTPHVSGVAALIKSTHPTYTAAQMKSALQTSSQDLGASGWDSSFGHGLLRGSAV